MLVIRVLGIVGYTRSDSTNSQYRSTHRDRHDRLDGAAPEEVESDITDKIEGAINTIDGIDELRSTSIEGFLRLRSPSSSTSREMSPPRRCETRWASCSAICRRASTPRS